MTAPAVVEVGRSDPWPCGCLGAPAVLALARGCLTYRQLNRWTVTLNLLTAYRHDPGTHHHLIDAGYGSGVPFGWPPHEAARAARAAQLIAAVTPDFHVRSTNSLPPEVALALADAGLVVELDGAPHLLTLVPLPVRSVT